MRVFNKDCDREVWDSAAKPAFLYFALTEWITESSMTDQEKLRFLIEISKGGNIHLMMHWGLWGWFYLSPERVLEFIRDDRCLKGRAVGTLTDDPREGVGCTAQLQSLGRFFCAVVVRFNHRFLLVIWFGYKSHYTKSSG